MCISIKIKWQFLNLWWMFQEPIKSGATLIISPAAISDQWMEEIQKHIKKESLKVFVSIHMYMYI